MPGLNLRPWLNWYPGGYPCCCRGRCAQCNGATDSDEVQVVLSGITPNTCYDCDEFNGTYICQRPGCSGDPLEYYPYCHWIYERTDYCDCVGLHVFVPVAGWTTYDVVIMLNFNSTSSAVCNRNLAWNIVWARTGSKPTDCNWSGASIPFLTNYASPCDGADAALLTAL